MPRLSRFVALSLLLACTQTFAGPPPQALQRYACTACHQPETRAVGPSWQEIATRYRNGSKTSEQLAQRIRQGSRGQWGVIPMPPQPQASDEDLAQIIDWVLEH